MLTRFWTPPRLKTRECGSTSTCVSSAWSSTGWRWRCRYEGNIWHHHTENIYQKYLPGWMQTRHLQSDDRHRAVDLPLCCSQDTQGVSRHWLHKVPRENNRHYLQKIFADTRWTGRRVYWTVTNTSPAESVSRSHPWPSWAASAGGSTGYSHTLTSTTGWSRKRNIRFCYQNISFSDKFLTPLKTSIIYVGDLRCL